MDTSENLKNVMACCRETHTHILPLPTPHPHNMPGSESLDEVIATSLSILLGPLLQKVSLQSKL